MNKNVVPFLLGMSVGFWGVRWFVYLAWFGTTIGAFFLGRYLA